LSPLVPSKTQYLNLENIDGKLDNINVKFMGNDAVEFDYKLENDELAITLSIEIDILGEYEGRIIIQHDGINYNIPVIIHKTKGSLLVDESEGVLHFTIDYPDDWTYTKITIINKDTGTIDSTSITPTHKKSFEVNQAGTYWVEALISGDVVLSEAYQIVDVKTPVAKNNFDFFEIIQIPERPLFIVLAVLGTIILVGLKIRK